MGAIILPPDISTTIADMQAQIRQLQTYRPSPPQLAPAVAPAMTLLNSTTGAGPIAFAASLTGMGATNTAFTTTAAGKVMIIGTGSVGNPLQPNMGGNCSVGESTTATFAPLAEASIATTAVGNMTCYFPVTSICVLTLAVGTYNAQWHAILTGTSASLNNWSIFVFQLSAGAAGTVAIP
jgi:hypothetical protein